MEVDPVILQLRADINGYLSDLRRTTNSVDQLLGAQEKRAQRLETEMRRSSEAIKGHIKGLGGVLAGAFSGRELVGLLDDFTRLQNSLRVAGLEGDALKSVQDQLLESSQRYGVEITTLANLFGQAAQAQNDLGASQTQLVTLTNATSAALKITGTSSVQASGAILGLSQALASGIVRAEEFNQINEGGLRPLLQVVAANEKYGGSVAKLRLAINDGKVTSQEFFAAIVQGSGDLEQKASKATLTLAGGVTALTSALTVYFGEADRANDVSATLGSALAALANNLDTIIPALATVATLIGTRYVVGMVAAAAATVAKTVADVRGTQVAAAYVAAQTEVAGILGVEAAAASRAAASVTALGVAQGVAARAGSGLLAVVGGPLGAATLALGAAIYLVAQRAEALDTATGAYAQVQTEANAATAKASELAQKLATAHGKAREEALALARAEQENIRKKLESARASLTLAQAELARAKAFRAAQNESARYSTGGAAGLGGSAYIRGTGDAKVSQAGANVKAAEDAVTKLEKSIADIGAAISAGAATPISSGDGKSKKGKGAKGPTAAEIAQRFNDELASLAQQTLSAQQSVATSAQERAELELRSVEIARLRALDGIQTDKDYSATQKERLKQQVEVLAAEERSRIAFEEKARLEQDARDLAQERYNNDRDGLQVQYDLADSQSERKRIALEMLDLELRYQKALLEAIIASETATAAKKERARIALEGVNATADRRRESTSRANEGPLDAYRRRLNRSSDAINEEVEGYVVDELNNVRDGIRGAIEKQLGIKDPLISGLLNLLIENVILKPLTDALASASGGGGGIGGALTSIGAAIFGRASGGYVAPGQMVRVNEGASPGRVEGFIPQGGGHIVPLGRMNALKSGGGGRVFNITVDARNSVTPDGFEQKILAEATRRAAQMDGQTAQATLKAMPGRMNQYQRDGF